MTFDTSWGMQVKISFRYTLRKHRDRGYLRRATSCHLTFTDKANHLMHGVFTTVTCDTRQQFVKEKGRTHALARALVEIGTTRTQRAEIWFHYHTRSTRTSPKAAAGAAAFIRHARRRGIPLGYFADDEEVGHAVH